MTILQYHPMDHIYNSDKEKWSEIYSHIDRLRELLRSESKDSENYEDLLEFVSDKIKTPIRA